MVRISLIALCVLQCAGVIFGERFPIFTAELEPIKQILVRPPSSFYSVVGPDTIRSNSKYNVAVSIFKADKTFQIQVGITGPSFNDKKTVKVQPGSTQNVEFDIPTLQYGEYYLNAVGLEGIIFKTSTLLNYVDDSPLIFIQTDKATYHPGDLVQYRAVFLDELTRPAKIDKPVNILITDGAQNIINQLSNVILTSGVYSGKFQLSDKTVLGNWEIEVNIDGAHRIRKSFVVAEYVLPKFDVSIETAKEVAIASKAIEVIVRSKYTYGMPLNGKATVFIQPAYEGYDVPKVTKTADVKDGKGYVKFDLQQDLHINDGSASIPPLEITAIVTEELTGNQQSGTATVNLHTNTYIIEAVKLPSFFKRDELVLYTIVVKNLDGSPVQTTENTVKCVATVDVLLNPIAVETKKQSKQKPVEFLMKLDKNGMGTFKLKLETPESKYYMVQCTYLDTTVDLPHIPELDQSPEFIQLTVENEEPQLGEDVSVDIEFGESVTSFAYTISAHGNVLISDFVNMDTLKVDLVKSDRLNLRLKGVPDIPFKTVKTQEFSYKLTFTPTFEMVPQATIFVYYVLDTQFRFKEQTIDFKHSFVNSITITAQEQAKPGDEVKLNIQTDPNSFVGILGVDQSVLLLKSGNDFNKDDIFSSLSSTGNRFYRFGNNPGQQSGLVTMTNANYPHYIAYPLDIDMVKRGGEDNVITSTATGTSDTPAVIAIRRKFEETWLFIDLEKVSAGTSISKQIPDTITSWVITGFSLNPDTGFALTENPTKIKVFQPFFISTNLPYSIKRGEVIAIPAIIFNYMDTPLKVTVTLDNSNNEFEFVEGIDDFKDNPLNLKQLEKSISVSSNSGKSVSFLIRPTIIGTLSLNIKADSSLAGDAIIQTLKVEAEGVTQYGNEAVFINVHDDTEYSYSLILDIPPTAVKGSAYIEFSVVGDILGPTIENLDELVRLPTGCGEQNMINFVPNILVLKYLEVVNQKNPTITAKATKFLEIGYQRELTYKHADGSYSAFGESDLVGSTWLTAYVMRSFLQAETYIFIDPSIIEQGMQFLANKQAEDGSFPEHGKLFDFAYQNKLGLTSFVLLAFLENEQYKTQYQTQIDRAVQFLVGNIDSSDDLYSMSIAAYALQLVDPALAKKLLIKLKTLANNDNDLEWWSPRPVTTSTKWSPRSNDVEITAYVALALMVNESPEVVLPIIKWLIAQRNSNGGFLSTQDTVVGLQALINFAQLTGYGKGQLVINFEANGGTSSLFKVDANNALLVQTYVLPSDVTEVNLVASGEGSAIVQLSYSYNVADTDKEGSFQIDATVKDGSPPLQLEVEVCVTYVPTDKGTESNMAILEVALPSGYTADRDLYELLQSADDVSLVQGDKLDTTVIIYFSSLKVGSATCLLVTASKTSDVANQLPAAVTVYDYYETSVRATAYYQVTSSLCDICEGDSCGSCPTDEKRN